MNVAVCIQLYEASAMSVGVMKGKSRMQTADMSLAGFIQYQYTHKYTNTNTKTIQKHHHYTRIDTQIHCEFKCTNINPSMQYKYTNTIKVIQYKFKYTNTIQIQLHRHVWGCHERQSSGRHVSTQLTQIGSNGLCCTVHCTKYNNFEIYTKYTNILAHIGFAVLCTAPNTNTYTQIQIQIQLTQIGTNGLRCTVYCTKYIYNNFRIQPQNTKIAIQYITRLTKYFGPKFSEQGHTF